MLFCFTFLSSSVLPGTPGDTHPKVSYQTCTKSGCTTQNGAVVIDANWRWTHDASYGNCFDASSNWDKTVCTGPEDCAAKCQLGSVNYTASGVATSGSTIRLNFMTPGGGVGSRIYLLNQDSGNYASFHMVNKEITFDIDTSTLGCGTNGALYFSEMYADGGMAAYPSNKAGAKYGTGYCDAQCPRDLHFIGDVANFDRQYGSCCYEWDIWEANARSTQWAAHACDVKESAYICESDCDKCDKNGCGWNPYQDSATGTISNFYGPSKTIDTTKKFTVVTQFISDNGADSGNLKEVRRLWIQGGKLIQTPNKQLSNGTATVETNILNDGTCTNSEGYAANGGDAGFTASFKRSAVMVMSLWTDGSMSWLDEGNNGDCDPPGGEAAVKEANANSYLEFSNIRYGDIDTTY
jgi:cellulose 1,4-beta-cellobiosidase